MERWAIGNDTVFVRIRPFFAGQTDRKPNCRLCHYDEKYRTIIHEGLYSKLYLYCTLRSYSTWLLLMLMSCGCHKHCFCSARVVFPTMEGMEILHGQKAGSIKKPIPVVLHIITGFIHGEHTFEKCKKLFQSTLI